MRKDDQALAQVIEFAASVTLLILVFTAFYTAVGFQAGRYTSATHRPTSKAIDASDYLMASPGYVAPNGTPWEEMSTRDLISDDAEGVNFGLSTGEYGVLSIEKIQRLEELNRTVYWQIYDLMQSSLGMSYVNPETGFVTAVYDINITIDRLDGTRILSWGYHDDKPIARVHTIITRLVLIQDGDEQYPARMKVDLIPLI